MSDKYTYAYIDGKWHGLILMNGYRISVHEVEPPKEIQSLQQEGQRLEAEIEKLKELVDIKNSQLVEVVPEAQRLREALSESLAAIYGAIGVNPELEGMGDVAHAKELAEKVLQGDKD